MLYSLENQYFAQIKNSFKSMISFTKAGPKLFNRSTGKNRNNFIFKKLKTKSINGKKDNKSDQGQKINIKV
mgnify:CR=1 FL=1